MSFPPNFRPKGDVEVFGSSLESNCLEISLYKQGAPISRIYLAQLQKYIFAPNIKDFIWRRDGNRVRWDKANAHSELDKDEDAAIEFTPKIEARLGEPDIPDEGHPSIRMDNYIWRTD